MGSPMTGARAINPWPFLKKTGSTIGGAVSGVFKEPSIPAPKPPPAPVDTFEPFIRELSRQALDRQIRQSKGRNASFGGAVEPYRAPGSKTTTGG